jgi:PAS domain S-box-containing protein
VMPDSQPYDEELVRLFDLSPDLFCIAGFDGYFKRVNRAFERALGYTQEELLERPYLSLTHPDDVESSREALAQLAEGEDIVGFQNRVVRADGSVLSLEWSTHTRPDEGFVYGVARDVTERHAADAKLKALRRVATLVAQGVEPEDVFAYVAQQVAGVMDAVRADVVRHVGGGETEACASFSPPSRAGTEEAGSTLEIPVVVGGRIWGAIVVTGMRQPSSREGPEARLVDFAALLAAAISNAESREALGRLADEQAALRRVATLVARGVEPAEIFSAVSAEVDGLFGLDDATVGRFDPEGRAFIVMGVAKGIEGLPIGSRWELNDAYVSSKVFRTGRSARIDVSDLDSIATPTAEWIRSRGFMSQVASPIVVDGRLWGALTVVTTDESLPSDTDKRLENFAELVATAIANTESKSELAASRARIVAASDDERRRMVRDLHDGAQQRLVHTIVTLKLARRALEPGGGDGLALVDEALRHAQAATDELRDLVHGMLPEVLARGGLRDAVSALASRVPIPVKTEITVDRLPRAVEATAYFTVAEALTNVVKHSRADHAQVRARLEDQGLELEVSDDGVGGAHAGGSGLVGLRDRLAVLDGTLSVESPADGGTRIAASIPVA